MKRSKLILRYIFMALSLILMVLIFCFSSQNGDESGGLSEDVAEILSSFFESVNLPNVADFWVTYIRKCAHFAIYAALGLCVSICFFTFDFKLKWLYLALPAAICFAYACSDELHQIFISGREGKFTDVLIDGAGFMTTILIANLINFLIYRKKQKKQITAVNNL